MNIRSPQVFSQMVAYGGELVKVAVFPMGPWDMDATDFILVPVPATFLPTAVLAIGCTVRDSTGLQFNTMDSANLGAAATPQLWITSLNAGVGANVSRAVGGRFDSPSYSSLAFSRGYLTVWYI